MRASQRSRETSCARGRWAVLLLASLTIAFSGRAYAQTYDVTDLGVLKSFRYSQVRALNNANPVLVAGYSTKDFTPQDTSHGAYRWRSGKMTKLGTLGGTSSLAYGINLGGWVVGDSNTRRDRATHAFLWIDGIMTDLGTLGGNESRAYDVNDSGVVVGYAETAAGYAHPFRWQNGQMLDLGTLGGEWSWAEGVSDSGDVAGGGDVCPGSDWCTHAGVWRGGTIIDLGTLPGGTSSYAHDVNDLGMAVGLASTAGTSVYRAFLWEDVNGNGVSDPGEMIDLGALGPFGDPQSEALAINNMGEVVGGSGCASYAFGCAFIWDEVNGMRNLNALIPPGSGWELTRAYDINDAGQIVGDGYYHVPPGDSRRAFLLTPR